MSIPITSSLRKNDRLIYSSDSLEGREGVIPMLVSKVCVSLYIQLLDTPVRNTP